MKLGLRKTLRLPSNHSQFFICNSESKAGRQCKSFALKCQKVELWIELCRCSSSCKLQCTHSEKKNFKIPSLLFPYARNDKCMFGYFERENKSTCGVNDVKQRVIANPINKKLMEKGKGSCNTSWRCIFQLPSFHSTFVYNMAYWHRQLLLVTRHGFYLPWRAGVYKIFLLGRGTGKFLFYRGAGNLGGALKSRGS